MSDMMAYRPVPDDLVRKLSELKTDEYYFVHWKGLAGVSNRDIDVVCIRYHLLATIDPKTGMFRFWKFPDLSEGYNEDGSPVTA